jgi:hypothetical protein
LSVMSSFRTRSVVMTACHAKNTNCDSPSESAAYLCGAWSCCTHHGQILQEQAQPRDGQAP